MFREQAVRQLLSPARVLNHVFSLWYTEQFLDPLHVPVHLFCLRGDVQFTN